MARSCPVSSPFPADRVGGVAAVLSRAGQLIVTVKLERERDGLPVDRRGELTPLGHVHRYHIRQPFSIDGIRDMYHEAMQRLLANTTSRSAYFGEAAVAVDTTAAEPFTGDREGHEDEIIGTKLNSSRYIFHIRQIVKLTLVA